MTTRPPRVCALRAPFPRTLKAAAIGFCGLVAADTHLLRKRASYVGAKVGHRPIRLGGGHVGTRVGHHQDLRTLTCPPARASDAAAQAGHRPARPWQYLRPRQKEPAPIPIEKNLPVSLH